jgi:uncharacterized Ntn-hydrolase superfamily protein
MTYSIIARDSATGAFGVAVQSHFFSVGSLVPWAEPEVGAVATQAFAEPKYGANGLAGLRAGRPAAEVLEELAAADDKREFRQVALIDRDGHTAARTGANCIAEAGHRSEDGVSAQGNMLATPGQWDAMVDAFAASSEAFPERLLSAVDAAEAKGGDVRGRQSAAILVVGLPEGPIDLRVEDHPRPLDELRRLLTYRRAYELLGGALLGTGLLLGSGAHPPPDVVELTLADLDSAQETLGDNPEPTFWKAVLLTRLCRFEEALAGFEWAAMKTPALREFAQRLPAAAFVDGESAEVREMLAALAAVPD